MTDEVQVVEMTETTTATAEPVEEEFDKERAMATIKKLREFEREADKLRKQVSAFEKAEAERKQAELSEMERLQAQYEEAAQKAARLERESLQRQAAETAGLPVALASRLQGETLEAMVEDAQAVLEALPKPQKDKPPQVLTTNPGANASQGETVEQKRARLIR